MTASRPMRTPSATTTCAPSQTLSPTSMPRAVRPWSSTGDIDAVVEVIAADEVGVGRDEHLPADPDRRRREHFDVEADVRVFVEHDVAVLAAQDRVAADEDAALDRDAAVGRALRVETALVVDDDVVVDLDLVRMPQHDVAAERDVPADAAENQRIQLRTQKQAERARHPGRQQQRPTRSARAATDPAARRRDRHSAARRDRLAPNSRWMSVMRASAAPGVRPQSAPLASRPRLS